VPESTAPVATAETADTPQTPPREPGARVVRVTAVVALVGVLLALVGLGLGLQPLATPTQDCGTAATFLLQGRVNEYVNPADPPPGITRAEAEANNAEPCQERAGNRALPAGALLVGGTLLAAVAVLVEAAVRFRLHRARNRRLAADLEL
jgi:hypothetical protein